jgi:hypothetical protein
MRDATDAAIIDGTEHYLTNFVMDADQVMAWSVIHTTDSPNHVISVNGKCTNAGAVSVLAANTVFTYVQLA